MKKVLSFIILINIFFSACECSYQYGVYARNESEEDIKVVYKSAIDLGSTYEQQVSLAPEEQKRIIYTEDIKLAEGCTGTTADHARFVAEYIYALDTDGQKSKLRWLDPTIEFFVEDVQQGTFTMVFNKDDF